MILDKSYWLLFFMVQEENKNLWPVMDIITPLFRQEVYSRDSLKEKDYSFTALHASKYNWYYTSVCFSLYCILSILIK